MICREARVRASQAGMVSFLVTMIMMMVITLIVVGFTQVVNQNRRDALDRQLSTQAYYAAESGVNDAMKKIDAILAADPGAALPTVEDCAGAQSAYSLPGASLSDGVSYSCLLIDPVNSSLEFSDIKTNMPTVVPLRPVDADGNPIAVTEVTLSWAPLAGSAAETSGCVADPVYRWQVDSPANCDFGVLRTEVFLPGSPADVTSGRSFALFARPQRYGGGGPPTVSFAAGGSTSQYAHCASAVKMCSITIAGLGGAQLVYLRANTIYSGAQRLVVTARNGGNPVFFIGQVKIDSTGKAQGVLRRIQVRYSPEANPADNPVSAVMGDNKICKRFAVGPSSYQDMASQCVAESEDADPTAEVKGGGDGGPGESKPDAVNWRRQFTNTSVNDPSLVESCTWDWGDGSAPEGGACLNGEIKKHEFIHPYRGNKCYAATVTLTIKLTNGKQKIATTTQKVAYGGGAADYCGNRWPAL